MRPPRTDAEDPWSRAGFAPLPAGRVTLLFDLWLPQGRRVRAASVLYRVRLPTLSLPRLAPPIRPGHVSSRHYLRAREVHHVRCLRPHRRRSGRVTGAIDYRPRLRCQCRRAFGQPLAEGLREVGLRCARACPTGALSLRTARSCDPAAESELIAITPVT
jgi:hypothetical protein